MFRVTASLATALRLLAPGFARADAAKPNLTGQECPLQDGKDKGSAPVYYNGPVLVVGKRTGVRATLWHNSDSPSPLRAIP